MIPSQFNFVVLGLLGALVYVIMWAKSFADLKTYGTFRHVIVGAAIGYVYSLLYSNYGFPDFIMCFVAGYMGPDFVEALVEKMKPKPPGGP